MNVPKEVIAAVLAVRKGVKSLKKADFNAHGKYSYVSIDTYYEQVTPIANANGLVWRCHEDDWKVVEFGNKVYAQASYLYDLLVGDQIAPDYMKVSVIGPIIGAQTSGQLYSYAEKVFMRVAFQVPTGEKDADDQEGSPIGSVKPAGAPVKKTLSMDEFRQGDVPMGHDPITGEIYDDGKPRLVVNNVEDTLQVGDNELVASKTPKGDPLIDTRKIKDNKACETVVEIFRAFLPEIKTYAQLTDWHAENLAAIETVGRINPAMRDMIRGMFRERKMQLQTPQK